MIPFITYREDERDGRRYYIVQKAFPHWRGVVTLYPLDNKLAQSVPITGFNLYVSFCGVLQGNFIPLQNNVEKEAQAMLQQMSEWYLEQRIKPNEKKYKKFKQPSHVQPAG